MAVDLYHQILFALFEQTGNDDRKVIDLAKLIRNHGFGGAIDDITEFLSREGWITEAHQLGSVRITKWGIDEAKRSLEASEPQKQDKLQSAAREIKKAADSARELAQALDDYASCLPRPDQQAKATKLRGSINDQVKVLAEKIAECNAMIK